MGKKKGGGIGYGINKQPAPTPGLVQHRALSLRQQKQQSEGGGAAASQSLAPSAVAAALRAEHLLRIATWASAHVPPLGALLGARLGCLSEAAGVPAPDTPHSICERCESVMQVGVNCSVRVTKSKRRGKARKKEAVCNYVTYVCHFCKHGNARPGTAKGHLKTKISQVAARAELEMLGKSSGAQVRSVDKKTPAEKLQRESLDVVEEKQLDSAEENVSKGVEVTLDVAEQEVAKAVEMIVDKVDQEVAEAVEVTLHKVVQDGARAVEGARNGVEQDGAKAVEMSLDEAQRDGAEAVVTTVDEVEQDGAQAVDTIVGKEAARAVDMNLDEVEQEGANVVEVTLEQGGATGVQLSLDKELLEVVEKNDERSHEKVVETILDKGPLDFAMKSQQGFAVPESPGAVEVSLDKEPLEESQQRSAEQEGLKAVETSLEKGLSSLIEINHHEQEGLKPVDIRKTLDVGKKKKKRKKNSQGAGEQEGPRASLGVESTDSSKKKKRKGWSNLKELAGVPQ